MANEELGKLSPEQIQKLANTISEAKDLTGQQEEIIKKVLAGETEIGKLRISSLEKYFDVYSRSLDKIARKHSSLNDAFLLLSGQLTDNYKTLSSDMDRLGKQLSSTAKELKKQGGEKGQKQATEHNTDVEEILTLAIQRLEKTFEDEAKVRSAAVAKGNTRLLALEKQFQTDRYNQLKAQIERFGGLTDNVSHRQGTSHELGREASPSNSAKALLDLERAKLHQAINGALEELSATTVGGHGDGGVGGGGSQNASVPPKNKITVTDEARANLGALDTSKKDVFEFFSEILAAEKAHSKLIKDIKTKNQAIDKKAEEKYLKELADIRDNFKNQLLSSEEAFNTARLKLEFEYNQTQEDRALRLTEFRLSKLKEATDAELKLIEDINKTAAQLKATGTKAGQKELGNARATKVNSEEELKSRQEVEAQIVKLRQKLEDEARAKNSGKLLKKDAAAIEAQLNAEYQKRLKNIKKLTKERFDSEKQIRELAELKENDPSFGADIEAKIQKETEDLIFNYKKDHQKELNAEELKHIKAQAMQKVLSNKETLLKEHLEEEKLKKLEKDDPALAATRKAEIAKKTAELEAKYREENNNILTEELHKRAEEEAKREFELGSENMKKLAALQVFKENNPELAAARAAEIAKKTVEFERKLKQENNNKLTAEMRATARRLAEEEFKLDSENFRKLAAEQVLKEVDPKLAEAREAAIVKRTAALELELREKNNNKLTAELIEQARKQAEAEFELDSANMKELAAQQTLKETDSGLTAAREAAMAKEIADLELYYKLENNKALDAEAKKAIQEQVEEKYKLEGEAMQKLAAEEALKQSDPKLFQMREEAMAKEKARYERQAREKSKDGKLSPEDAKRINEEIKKKYELEGKEMEKLAKKRNKDEKKDAIKEGRKKTEGAVTGPIDKDHSLVDRFKELKQITEDKLPENATGIQKASAAIDTAIVAMGALIAQLEDKIDKIGEYQGVIDTRLQGSNNKKSSGSYWSQLTKDMMSVGAVTPYFKQEDFANNIKSLVEKGISFDLKQRAFLMTIQEKIANTFDVADGTLLRLIRIQQEDSTAGRLGMESALNTFLNEMYETSEYLTDVAKGVRGSLEEMEALMGGKEATEVEYQVQKWMGSLYSVGMSSEAVNSIAQAFGQIAAGQVDALTSNNGAGNLVVMAANNAGKSISEILTKGLNAEETNKLLHATVEYLAEIANSSKNNNVVQQQLANVFGIKASDLKAATNLKVSTDSAKKDSTGAIYGKNLTYDNMLKQLNNMAGSMGSRTSWGEKLTNIWSNGQYSLASSIANNPAAYFIMKAAGLLEGATGGGIDLPFINVMGFGVDLNMSVADLMRIGAMSAGILGSIGSMFSGLGNSFNGRAMLQKMGISEGNGLQINARGGASGGVSSLAGGGSESTSESGYIGNSLSSDVKDSTIQESEDSKKQQMIEAKEEAEENQVDVLNMYVLKMYELLDDVVSGKRNFTVKVAGYGLTKSGNASNALGGVNGLLSNSSGSTSSGNVTSNAGSSSGGSTGASNSGLGNTGNTGNTFGSGTSGGLNLGGWTTI